MLHAAIARPEKVAALVGIAVAADHFVSTFQQLSVEVKRDIGFPDQKHMFWDLFKCRTQYCKDHYLL